MKPGHQKDRGGFEQFENFSAHDSRRQTERQEWWLWGYAITVTLVLTLGVLCFALPESHFVGDEFYSIRLTEWVRGLAALVLLFDIYTIYQHLQLQRIRKQLEARDRVFHLIAENAADMIAVVDKNGKRIYNSPVYEKTLGYTRQELALTSRITENPS